MYIIIYVCIVIIYMVHFEARVPRLANLLLLWIISFVLGGRTWAMVGDIRDGLLSFKEICLCYTVHVTKSSFRLLNRV